MPSTRNKNWYHFLASALHGTRKLACVPLLCLAIGALPTALLAEDCNNNSVEDATDIADGTSDDCQPDGIPDECQTPSGTCGDGAADCLSGEQCDGADDAACPGECGANCACQETWLYWIENARTSSSGLIRRYRVGDSEPETLVSNREFPTDIDIDLPRGKIYWTEGLGSERIYRANLDGSSVQNAVSTFRPAGIAIDIAGMRLFWTRTGNDDQVRTRAFSGTVDTILWEEPVNNNRIGWIDLHQGIQRIFWSARNCTPSCNWVIRSANFDGSDLTEVVFVTPDEPEALVVDAVNDTIYWGEDFAIRRADLDGSNMTVVSQAVGLMEARGLAIDNIGDRVYWTSNQDGSIRSKDLTPPNLMTPLVVANVQDPGGIAITRLCPMRPGDLDCQSNGNPDSCDIAAGSLDCQPNGIPDECEPDCEGDGIPDDCAIAQGAIDCQPNGIPDSCETDCDRNGVSDDCDIAGGATDDNMNGVLDICEAAPLIGEDTCHASNGSNLGTPCSSNDDCVAPQVCGVKSRYLSIRLPGAISVAIQVTLLDVPLNPAREGEVWWAGPEQALNNAPNPSLRGASLECTTTPHAQVWTDGVLHLWGAAIVPESRYELRACQPDGTGCSAPLVVATGKYGDIIAPFGGGTQPTLGDVNAAVVKFQGSPLAPDTPRTDQRRVGSNGLPNTPNQITDFADVNATVIAFSGQTYPHPVAACP